MSLEQQIAALTAAVEANTAALLGGAALTAAVEANTAALLGGAATTTKTSSKTSTKSSSAEKPKYKKEEVVALLTRIKDEHDVKHAKEILAANGVDKMANMPDDKLTAIGDQATAKLEELSADSGDI